MSYKQVNDSLSADSEEIQSKIRLKKMGGNIKNSVNHDNKNLDTIKKNIEHTAGIKKNPENSNIQLNQKL